MVCFSRAMVVTLSKETKLCAFFHVIMFGHQEGVVSESWHEGVSVCRTGDS